MKNLEEPIELKQIHLSEIYELQAMSKQTFLDAFSWSTTAENINAYVESAFSIEQLQWQISDPESQFYFAVTGNMRVGYLKLNFGEAQTEYKERSAMEIERIYIAKEHQGKKIGQALMNKAIAIANENGCRYVWLGVWEKNHGAISFYKRNGFVEIGTHPFMLGTDEQTDLIMRRDLRP